jgi:hypothetical protein
VNDRFDKPSGATGATPAELLQRQLKPPMGVILAWFILPLAFVCAVEWLGIAESLSQWVHTLD